VSGVTWLRAGARTLSFRSPRTPELQARPATVVMLLALSLGLGIGVQRLAIGSPAQFDLSALHSGWLASVLALGTCWVVVRSHDAAGSSPGRPSVATLFALLLAQQLWVSALLSAAYVATVFWVPRQASVDTDALLHTVWMAALLWPLSLMRC